MLPLLKQFNDAKEEESRFSEFEKRVNTTFKSILGIDFMKGGKSKKQLTQKEAYAQAKALGIKGRSKMSKEELIKAIAKTKASQKKKKQKS